MKKTLQLIFLLATFCLSSTLVFSQKKKTYYQAGFKSIDSLALAAKPKEAIQILNLLIENARKDQQTTVIIRATMYRMLFKGYLEEDAFSKINKDLKQDIAIASQPVKSILESLLAESYWKYYEQNRYQLMSRSAVQSNLGDDIKTWPASKFLEETAKSYLASISESKILHNTKIDSLSEMMVGDEQNRFLRPTLYDILAHRALDVLVNTQIEINKNDDSIDFNNVKWFNNADAFLKIEIPTKDSTSFSAKALVIFQNLIRIHQENANVAALADIDLKRLNFIYSRSSREDKMALYSAAVQKLANSSKSTEFYADILFELASKKYESRNLQLPNLKIDLKELLEMGNLAIAAYPKSLGAKNFEKLIADIKSKSLAISMNQFLVPGKPTQLHFRYRNANTIALQLFRLNQITNRFQFNDTTDYQKFIAKNKIYKEWTIDLPESDDYQEHTIVDKLDGLEIGQYVIIAHTAKSDAAFKYASFQVTDLAVTNRITGILNHQYFVANSSTGEAISKAIVNEENNEYENGKYVFKTRGTLYTDKNGFAESSLNASVNHIEIIHGNDTVAMDINQRVYKYMSIKNKVVLFTDRPIYRPGQTVYYKGIYFEYAEDKNQILKESSVDIVFNDANRKEIEKTSKITNEFGTFHGSFTIPMGKLNGRMSINTTYGSIDILVEEYKRPTFEIAFDQLNQKYRLNDSVSIRGKAISFAGYAVSGAKVKYVVTRNILSAYNRIYGYTPSKQIATGTTETKAGGAFDIRFLASAENSLINAYSYQINIDITDLNGETRSKSQFVNAGKSDVLLTVDVPENIFPAQLNENIAFEITNLNRTPIKGKLSVEWYKLEYPGRIVYPNMFGKPEKYNLTKTEFIKHFPYDDYENDGNPEGWAAKNISFIQHQKVEQGSGHLEMKNIKLNSGYYKVKFKALNEDQDSVIVEKTVRVYENASEKILLAREWLVAEKTTITPNEMAIFRFASVLPNARAYYEVYYKDIIIKKVWLNLTNKQELVSIKPEDGFIDGFAVQFSLIQNGKIYQSMNVINIVDESKELDIKFLSFRDKLQPGEKDVWKLKIANKKGEKQMAEMVVSLYDASLDDLKTMSWNKIATPKYNYNIFDWGYNLNIIENGNEIWYRNRYRGYYDIEKRDYERINSYGFDFNAYNLKYNYTQYLAKIEANKIKSLSEAATKKLATLKASGLVYGIVTDQSGYGVPGIAVRVGKKGATTDSYGIYSIDAKIGEEISVTFIGYHRATTKAGAEKRIDFKLIEDGQGLNEVVVVGYGAKMRKDVTASVSMLREEVAASPAGEGVRIQLRGTNSVAYDQNGAPTPNGQRGAIAVEDNKVYDFVSIEGYDPKTDTYIINGKPVKKPKIVPRTNFTETAFFYPQLKTNEAGEIEIEFTIPQSLTRYKMMGFAHTKDFKTKTITKELVTQKKLSISANAPRFFREGDTILLSAKLNNLSGKPIGGFAILELRDAITGKAISIIDKKETVQQKFQLENNGNQSLKWSLVIPSGIGAITYKLTAQSENYTDGEEMTVPVLPYSVLVTESMPMNVHGGTKKTFTMDKLLQSANSKTLKNQSLTFEFTSNPVWYAVQALPYLMEYPYECAEQTFSRFYANSFATGIINSSPKIKAVFESWQQTNNGEALLSNLEKNPALKSILLEETPWVRNAENETERKKRLSVLFDLNRMTYELKANFDKLENMQFSNGAFPWFTGMQEDRYITQHIVMGIGQLKYLKLVDEKSFPKLNPMLFKAINYLDAKMVEDYTLDLKLKRKGFDYQTLHYLYARSYVNQKNNDAKYIKAVDYFLKMITAKWIYLNPYQQAQTAIVLFRNGKEAEALKVIELLKQRAQHSDEMGMYWADNADGYFWYQSPIETQALLIEAFEEVAKDSKSVEEMKIWLLKNKQTNDWKTTKATAAASYALLMRGYNLLDESAEPEISIGGKSFAEMGIAEPAKEAGTGYQKITIAGQNVKPEMAKVEIKNNNKSIAWGAFYWQYFEQLDKITAASTGVKINKQLFLQKQTEKGSLLTLLTNSNVLSPGDLLKVRIEIFCDRDMEYVHLKDMRSSGFEPVNVISQYKYQDGLGYYESTKDASTNFFISYLHKGTYVFEYPLRVTHAGNFSNGITTLQSMYAPEFTTQSAGVRVAVKP